MLSDNHDLCVLDFINNVNAHVKSKSAKKTSKRKVWKPTGKVFINIGYILRPTGRTFTIVGNACPLTRITTTTEVPLRKPTVLDNETPKPIITLVYSRKPRNLTKYSGRPNFSLVQSNSELITCKVYMGIWVDYQDRECYDIKGLLCRRTWIQLILRWANEDVLSYMSLVQGSKTNSWLWHQKISHLNFGAINHLAGHGFMRGIPKLKFEKDHLCSACAMGKSKKKPHKPKSEDTNQEKLYLLHMDLCGPMCVASINGKKYILVIVDD
ncbi:retrovirus-related pol polyprotein from transposon TNT 1-94 [Tanacetum coccineum]